ncbi:efflux RND transporter periplasmic adaptor subunit [Fluoribacter dumoffii]|uniref:HelB protein n=2 Tax=Legionellaceae TaxID=444 RepID=A0A0W0SC66_9GAMM|nr:MULTISPECIES: efflux RND transporter periplasmic adaptor subunit [Legionellaceae]HAT1993796.1 HlyD family efflux transporter periplasmic adaptor subunit [Legionella pneumophila]KTC81091.1 HelB protein [Legionella cherrii]KTC91303.1 HelB protein [Fluoribacter dumoffii NY 23]MCW8416925.1 efflux RND transporter periplasmic adaptor subunit [Fluoribacter dumoffii]MCW8455235.1 efflux RND transporter periplasmic adaptor subunit [Fluoribacter dumoffii]
MKLIKKFVSLLFLIIFISTLITPVVFGADDDNQQSESQEEFEKGPHGGRLFKKDNITLEFLLFERGMPPHFRAYLYQEGEAIPSNSSQLTAELTRFNGGKEVITFKPIENFLQSNQVIKEPHSFDVSLQLTLSGKVYGWQYKSYEGRVKLVPDILQSANIQTEKAESQTIKTQLKVVGKIAPNRDTMAPIYARYAGIIKVMNKNLGDEVIKGDLLATIESNESLQNYNINAPITGTIVQKYSTNGELAQNNKPIYDIANLTNVWADFTLYRKDTPLVKTGMTIDVIGDEGKPKTTSHISYIASLGIEDSQTTLARAILPNEQRLWIPGMYVNGYIIIEEKTVPVAVLLTALQRIGDQDVVFVQQGDYFEATPVELGQRDKQWAEVLSGLDVGQRYVTKNSFYLKAEMGKEGASHEH